MQPDATRLNLEVDITNSPLLPLLQAAEQAIIQKAYADGIFEGTLEDTAKQFHSSIAFSEKYASYRLRAKINVAGLKQCRFFLVPEKPSRLFRT